MPIYEYRCTSCGHKLEALQKFSDAPLSACPSCNADGLVKLVSAAGFQLKGSGWYATDFKGSGAKPAATTENADSKAESAATGAKPGESKSDTASEAKADSKSERKSESKSETKGGGAAPPAGTAPPATT